MPSGKDDTLVQFLAAAHPSRRSAWPGGGGISALFPTMELLRSDEFLRFPVKSWSKSSETNYFCKKILFFRSGQSTVGGPTWTKMDLCGPKWTKIWCLECKINSSSEYGHCDQNGRFDHVGPFWASVPSDTTVPTP